MNKCIVYYYYQVCRAALGPYKFGELMTLIQAGDVKSNTPVWREGINQWYPLCAYREFHLSSEHELGLEGESKRNLIGTGQVMETEPLAKRKNPYHVLGVPSFAKANQIRSAYKKRVKVLDPYRFDKTSQPIEWQIVNDILVELNQAYAQVHSSDHNGKDHGEATTTSQNRSRPAEAIQIDTPMNRGNRKCDVAETQHLMKSKPLIL